MATERFSLLLIVCILVEFSDVCDSMHVPVLLWRSGGMSNSEGNSPSSFAKVSTDDFHSHISNALTAGDTKAKQAVILFVEEMLSVEDFSRKTVHGLSPYQFLTGLTSRSSMVDFFPSVQTPLKALKRLDYEWKELDVRDGINSSVASKGSVILSVNFHNSVTDGKERSDLLKQHDQMMNELYSKLLKIYPDVLGIYTSRRPSWNEPDTFTSRKLFAADEVKKANGTKWHDDNVNVLIYFNSPPTYHIHGTEATGVITSTDDITYTAITNDTHIEQRLYIGITVNETSPQPHGQLQFVFYLSREKSYWRLEYINYTDSIFSGEILRPTSEIIAPKDFSFHCSQNISFINPLINLKFNNFQIQAFKKDKTGLKFGDAYDCVYFYTPAILSGLFVTAMMALIIMWGLSMIMDIHTNDQYDDPKGQTISVNATE